MGEDKPNRRFLRITIQKQLLVLHNQVIGVRIVRCAFLFVGELAVGHLALLIDGKITGMGIMGGNFIQIPHIVVIAKFKLHRAEDIVVFFLKHIGINAVERTPRLIILLILRDLVDKEQGQHLDPLVEKLPFPLNMGEDGFADLNTPELVFADLADDIARVDFHAVQKRHGIIPSVDCLDDIADLVLIQIAGVIVQVVADADRCGFLADAGYALEVKLNGCRRVCLG